LRVLFANVLLGVVAVAGAYFWMQPSPETPRELFNIRCATCHERPDLAGYTASEKQGIVLTMLRERGANQVITADEADKIIEYITATGISISREDQGDGNT
jgi:hypothetical protein